MNQYFEHITAVTPGILSSLFIWKNWYSNDTEAEEVGKHIDTAITALTSLNDALIEKENSMIHGDEYDTHNGRK